MSSSSWTGQGPSAPASHPSSSSNPAEPMQRTSSSDRPQKKTQARQLLSCTKCRERKVKCDRTKPCSTCCARGHPKECEFVVSEGNNYGAIQQSYEIRKLRLENQRLRERLQAAKLGHSGDETDDDESSAPSTKAGRRAASPRQRRFKTSDRVDNLYFGSPSLANMVSDFANLQLGSQSLSHPMPRIAPQDVYAPSASMYPFHILWQTALGPAPLFQLLPPTTEIFDLLARFQRRAQLCSFPHTPDEVTKKEVERFLADMEGNAEKFPDMLALIFATLATGLQMGQHDRSGGEWVDGDIDATARKSDVFVAASMQALRLASFMNQPTLLGVQTLVVIGPYLTNSGRFLDAWTLFGLTIRMAHSIGLHRDPKLLDPVPPLRECMVRRSIWWWMLHMDQQYSVALGRPLGISGYGDCPPPETLTTNQELRRLGEFIHHFTVLARQILASDSMSVAKIDEFTDKLIGLWDTMPEALQFNESWLRPDTLLPEWPLDVVPASTWINFSYSAIYSAHYATDLFANVQSYLVLLNRQRVERTQSFVDTSPPGSSAQPSSSSRANDLPSHSAVIRGRSLVIHSSVSILKAFLFFHFRNPAVLISWNIGQQAFNAAMILLLDAWEMDNDQHQWLVSQAYVVFNELETKHVHRLAGLAVRRISDGLAKLGNRRAERERQQQQEQQQMAASAREQQQYALPTLTLDTASMADWSGDTVMGNTGMFLLEDAGLQNFGAQSFEPLTWTMAGSGSGNINNVTGFPLSKPSSPTSFASGVQARRVPVAPFPIIPDVVVGPATMSSHGTGSRLSQQQQPPPPPQQANQRRYSNSRRAPYPVHRQPPLQQSWQQPPLQPPAPLLC